MAATTIEELRAALDETVAAFKKGSPVTKELQTRFEQQIVAGDVGAVAKCVDGFLEAELDFKTPGDRGIGRASPNIPRLGAYFRKELQASSEQLRAEIAGDIRALVWRGYLCASLLMEPYVRSGAEPPNELFDDWIPRIYSATPPETAWGVATTVAGPALERLTARLKKHGMVRRGLFSKDKTTEIATYYLAAGLLLGDCEKRSAARTR